MILEDGKGSGRKAEVSDENMLVVEAVQQKRQMHSNQDFGDTYTVDLDAVTAAQDADYFVYMLNSDDKDMVVTSVTMWNNQNKDDDNVEVWLGKTITSVANNTVVTPANCNAGSGNTASGTFYVSDGTAGGLTTLAGGAATGRMKFNMSPTKWVKDSGWIVPKNQTFCLKAEKNNIYYGYISFYYHG